MSFLSGVFLLDCPASALNNAGADTGTRTENAVAIKKIATKEGYYPYVSAQAFRYWWREALKGVPGWTVTPLFREGKIAYSDANPILYAEDDLFGYMRAPSKKGDAKKKREEENTLANATELTENVTLTRQSPLKVSTLVSIAPVPVTTDFGVMARHEGNPVLFEHEFYRTTLEGLFSLDLGMVGRFYHIQRTGYKHLDQVRVDLAKERGLNEYDGGKAYQLPLEERYERVCQLMTGFINLTGGAKQAIHYTDVTPRFVLLAVTKGGNHLFATTINASNKGLPVINLNALKETVKIWRKEIISGIYVGLMQGYLDEQREGLEKTLTEIATEPEYGQIKTFFGHPREAVSEFLADLKEGQAQWLA